MLELNILPALTLDHAAKGRLGGQENDGEAGIAVRRWLFKDNNICMVMIIKKTALMVVKPNIRFTPNTYFLMLGEKT